MKRILAFALTLLMVPIVIGCSKHHRMSEVPLVVALPQEYSASGTTTAPLHWWQVFNDNELNSLMETAFSENLDLKVAWNRLSQAEASTSYSRSARRFSVDGSLAVTRRKSVFLQGAAFGARGVNAFYLSQYDMSVAANYEVDLWNRLRSQVRASSRDERAARNDLETIGLSLSATLCEAWFQLIEQQSQLQLVNEQIKVAQTFLELLELRLGQGVSSALDVYQQKQQLASTRALLPQIKSQEAVLKHQLATLLALLPNTDDFQIPAKLPQLPPLPATGLPIEILDNRPDVRAAMQRVLAADHRVAAAVASLRPNLNIRPTTGFSSSTTSSLFDNFIWSVGSSLLGPIIDGGRRRAEVRRSKAFVAEQLNRYGSIVLTAIREVEDALAREKFHRQYISELDKNLALSEATLEEAKARYLNGLSDYLPFLTALVSLQNLQRTRVSAQRQLLSYRISLHRALGGKWTTQLMRKEEEK